MCGILQMCKLSLLTMLFLLLLVMLRQYYIMHFTQLALH